MRHTCQSAWGNVLNNEHSTVYADVVSNICFGLQGTRRSSSMTSLQQWSTTRSLCLGVSGL